VPHGTDNEISTLRIRFSDDFLSFQKDDSVETAHRHHQAVKDLAPGFTAVARSKDGIIEAISGHGHYGIQWHAESDGTAGPIYGAFISICSGRYQVAARYETAPEAA
jgi:gamma-glutamyl-gamma-aminobutyrate hydrolase PuuD